MVSHPNRTKTIKVSQKILAHCFVKSERATNLSLEEMEALINWCGCQRADLWEGMGLQEILNVYRATAEYETFEGWAEEDWQSAYKAWNSAVINPDNRMTPRGNS